MEDWVKIVYAIMIAFIILVQFILSNRDINKNKMRKLIRAVRGFIQRLFNKLEAEIREAVPVAIKIVEGVKKVMESPVDDVVLTIVKGAIPGTADDILIDKVTKIVEKEIPIILLNLNMISSIANIEDPNEQLKAIIAKLKLSPDDTKNAVYHILASKVLESLSDGELSWSEAAMLSEYYYKKILKK